MLLLSLPPPPLFPDTPRPRPGPDPPRPNALQQTNRPNAGAAVNEQSPLSAASHPARLPKWGGIGPAARTGWPGCLLARTANEMARLHTSRRAWTDVKWAERATLPPPHEGLQPLSLCIARVGSQRSGCQRRHTHLASRWRDKVKKGGGKSVQAGRGPARVVHSTPAPHSAVLLLLLTYTVAVSLFARTGRQARPYIQYTWYTQGEGEGCRSSAARLAPLPPLLPPPPPAAAWAGTVNNTCWGGLVVEGGPARPEARLLLHEEAT